MCIQCYYYYDLLQASTFNELLDASGGAEEDGYKALTALGLISAIQSLVKSGFRNTEILKQMEAVLVTTIVSIFQNGVMGKSYDIWLDVLHTVYMYVYFILHT